MTNSSDPLMCTNDFECKSTISPTWYPVSDGECLCFPNLYGLQFCKPFPADYDSDYFTRMKKFYSQDFTQCFIFDIGSWEGCAILEEVSYNFWEKTVGDNRMPECGDRILYDGDRYKLNEAKDLYYQWTYADNNLVYLREMFVLFAVWNLLF